MNIPIYTLTNGLDRLFTAIRYAIIGTIFLSFSGCVTVPLKTEQQRQRLGEAIGSEPAEIAFMNYCFFEEIQESNTEKRSKRVRGIVAVTDNELCLMDGVLRSGPRNYFLKIPVSEIVGVNSSKIHMQVQIKLQDKLLVLFLYNWNDIRRDSALTTELYQSLILADVPRFETSEYYSWNGSGGSGNAGGNQQGLPPVNDKASAQKSQQADIDQRVDRLYGR